MRFLTLKQASSLFLAVFFVFCFSVQGIEARRGKPRIEGVININTATLEQLTLLPRIGLKKARMIVEQRKRKPFQNPRDITRVKGIGHKTYLRLKPFLTTTTPTKLNPPSASK